MKTIKRSKQTALGFSIALLLCWAVQCHAVDFTLSATTAGSNKRDMGVFSAGEVVSISFTGQISLIEGWDALADGSLAHPLSIPEFNYANANAGDYPTTYGGDGTNHFINGGVNFDAVLGGIPGFGIAGTTTTDTANPNTIRLGSVIGTFSPNPARSDWFAVGISNSIVVPADGIHLYLAIHDTTYANNSGSFSGKLTSVNPQLLNARTYAGFELVGEVGQDYRIDYSSVFPPVSWQVLTNLVLPASPYLIIDTTGPVSGNRFYRAVKTQ